MVTTIMLGTSNFLAKNNKIIVGKPSSNFNIYYPREMKIKITDSKT